MNGPHRVARLAVSTLLLTVSLGLIAPAAARAGEDAKPAAAAKAGEDDDKLKPSVDVRTKLGLWYALGESTMEERSVPGDQISFETRYHGFAHAMFTFDAGAVFFRLLGVELEGGISVTDATNAGLSLDTVQRAPVAGTLSQFQLSSKGSRDYFELSLVHRVVPPEKTGIRGWTADLLLGYGFFYSAWKDSDAHPPGAAIAAPGKVRESTWTWNVLRLGMRVGYEHKYVGFEAMAAIYPYGQFDERETYDQGGTNFGSNGTRFSVRSYGFAGGELEASFLILPVSILRIEIGYKLHYLYSEEGRGGGHDASGAPLLTAGKVATSLHHGPTIGVTLIF